MNTAAAERPPHGYFVDRTRAPSSASIRAVLGRAVAAWDDLTEHLEEICGLKGSYHFMYGKRYGWALRFERNGRLVVALYPNQGHLTMQVILSQAQIAAATAMALPPSVVRALDAATDYPEGRWLFVPVRSRDDARELTSLIALKLSRSPRGHPIDR